MTSAPNYNDGRWHGWNGGECPVHPETVVDALFGDGGKQPEIKGDCLDWSGPDKLPSSHVAAFRVVKEHREPRTVTLWEDEAGNFGVVCGMGYFTPRTFREVLE